MQRATTPPRRACPARCAASFPAEVFAAVRLLTGLFFLLLAAASANGSSNPFSVTVTGTTYTTSGTIPTPPTGTNGVYTSFNYFNHGITTVDANMMIGSGTADIPYWPWENTGPWTLGNGGNTSDGDGSTTYTGAVLNVGDATHNVVLILVDVNADLYNYNRNTINLSAGSSIYLIANVVADGTVPNYHNTSVVMEGGTFRQGGTVEFGPISTYNPSQTLFTNDGGTWTISSTSAEIVRVHPANVQSGTYDPTFPEIVNEAGILSGSGRLTYVNLGGPASENITTLIHYGTLAPGTTGTIGNIEFDNLNLDFGSNSTLKIRVGGASAGQFDTVTLVGGQLNLVNSPVNVTVTIVPGFTPVNGQTWQIMNYTSLAPGSSFVTGPSEDTITTGFSLYLYPNFAVLLYGTPAPAPVITSSTTATCTVGASFNYQIAASNNPFLFSGTGLPSGLTTNGTTGLISGTPTVAGTYTATIGAANISGTGSAPLQIAILTQYQAWQTGWFTPAQLANPQISGDKASPAGDGIPNLMKYALGLNPFQSYSSTSVGYPSMGTTTSGTNEYLTLTFTGSAPDVSYIVQAAGNPGGSWTPIYTSGTGNPPGTITVSDTVPMSSATKRFMQLQVIGP